MAKLYLVTKQWGIKGYFATVTMKTDTDTNNGGLKSLFAVSSEFIGK